MAQPAEVERLADRLAADYRNAWQRIVDEQQAIVDNPRQWRRRRRLDELQRSVEDLMDSVDAQARAWLTRDFPAAYAAGGSNTAVELGAAFVWTQPHVEAVNALAGDLFDDLLQATRFVRRRTKQLIREITRARTSLSLVRGDTAVQAAKAAQRELAERGIWAVTYKDGSRHGLGEYAEMAVRTKTAVAYNAGTLGFATSAGVGWFEVFDGFGCGWTHHDDVRKANGMIVTAADAAAHALAHPRCRRAFGARPDITSPAAAGQAAPSTTAAQRDDQANFEQARSRVLDARRRRLDQRARRLAARR